MLRYIRNAHTKLTSIYSADLKRYLSNQHAYRDKLNTLEMSNPTYRVKGNNILTDILYWLDIDATRRDAMTTIAHARDVSESLSNSVGIVHADSEGRLHQNNFFPCNEVFVLNRNLDSIAKLLAISSPTSGKWTELEPVTVLTAPYGWNPLNVPHGNHETIEYEDAYAVMSINVVHLAVMYRAWLVEQATVDEKESTSIFIAKYVIPNMLSSLGRACLLPLVRASAMDDPYVQMPYKGSFYAKDYMLSMYDEYRVVLQSIPKRRMRGDSILQLITTDGVNSMADNLPALHDRYTSQNSWAMTLIALPYFELIIAVLDLDGDPEKDGDLTNDFKQFRKYYESNKTLEKIDKPELMYSIKDRIKYLEFKLGI